MDTLEVKVAAVNGKGFKTVDGAWLNISKYAKIDDVPLPKAGEVVKVSLDKAGFVRKIEPSSWVNLPNTAGQAQGQAEGQADGHVTGQTVTEHANVSPGRDTVVTRLACLNTATAILSSGGRPADPAEVVTLAAKLEAWALRTSLRAS